MRFQVACTFCSVVCSDADNDDDDVIVGVFNLIGGPFCYWGLPNFCTCWQQLVEVSWPKLRSTLFHLLRRMLLHI